MVGSLSSHILNTNNSQRKSSHENSVTVATSLILYHFWKTNELYIWTTRNVIISSWFLQLDLVNYTASPSETCVIRLVGDSITKGMFLDTCKRFMAAWNPPRHFAWLCNDVNIYCHCHRHGKITQIQPGYCSCSLYRATCSTPLLALNLRDISSELVSTRWIFHSAQTLFEEEGNQWLTLWAPVFCSRFQLGLSLIGVMLIL